MQQLLQSVMKQMTTKIDVNSRFETFYFTPLRPLAKAKGHQILECRLMKKRKSI